MAEARRDVLIVGSGHGGAHAAIALRRLGFPGTVAIVTKERDPPYERPPLSKDYLAGKRPFERLLMRAPDYWAGQGIELMLGREAAAIDPAARRLRLADGGEIAYGDLVWAAGGRPRTLGGGGVARVHAVRGRTDVDALRAELAGSAAVAVVGGGYVGLEAAAVLAEAGARVTVLEAADRLLARVASLELSRFFEGEHRRRGVDVRLGAAAERIEARAGTATGVRLAGGAVVPADIVIVGIGIEPVVGPLAAAGAALAAGGVRVDDHCRTGLPGVFAVGDCAAHANPFAGGAVVRLESVQNAHDQAVTAARAIAGAPEPYRAVPWFWSEQYGHRLQTVGLSVGHDRIVTRGGGESFSLVYLKAGRVIALDCVNNVRDYAQGRLLVAEGAAPPPERLADPRVPLKSLAGPA